jgi:hypothetical protein
MTSTTMHRHLRLLTQAMADTGYPLERLAHLLGIPTHKLAAWLSGEVPAPLRWRSIDFLTSLPKDLGDQWIVRLRE